jgi:uncharacterized membrane protein
MRVAGSIIMGVIGAILYFAVTADVAGISLDMVGVILMVAAAIWFVLELVRGMTGDRVQSSTTVQNPDGTVQRRETNVRETHVTDER